MVYDTLRCSISKLYICKCHMTTYTCCICTDLTFEKIEQIANGCTHESGWGTQLHRGLSGTVLPFGGIYSIRRWHSQHCGLPAFSLTTNRVHLATREIDSCLILILTRLYGDGYFKVLSSLKHVACMAFSFHILQNLLSGSSL